MSEGTEVTLFVLKDYCGKCTHCLKDGKHCYQAKKFERWQCRLQAREHLTVRLNKRNVFQYAYTDKSTVFTFLTHACPNFVMISMESEQKPLVLIDSLSV